MSVANAQTPIRPRLYYFLLFLVAAGLILFALVLPELVPLSVPSIQSGQVASQDILAPKDIAYESQVLTEQQRDAAARSVPLIFTSPDTSVARQRLEDLRTTLNYIASVRADTFASAEQKIADLAALEGIHLSQDTTETILALNDSRWQAVQQEAIAVLEQVMRSTIREDRLEEARRNIPTLVSLTLPESQAGLVAELVPAFVAPNSYYSESLTEAAREKARESVSPVTRTFKAGETVVQRGQIISQATLEALQKMGLVQSQFTWNKLFSAASLVVLNMSFLVFYMRRKPRLRKDARGLTLSAILFLIFLISARLVITRSTVIPYMFPLAAYSLTISVLFGLEPALVSTLPLAVMVGYGLPNGLELSLFYIVGSFFGVFAVGNARRLTAFFWAGSAIASSAAVLTVVYRLPQPNIDWLAVSTVIGSAFLNGFASASLAVLLQFLLAQFLGMTTALQLMEISRPDHTLLQLLLRNAPGTYQHSLQVANLSEQAAERIGADPLLTRVGALYHDVGKIQNPAFFIENQAPGTPNPHNELDPFSSAQIILSHVTDGLELARKYRLPVRIQDFISEHHGTLLTRYQYINAVNAVGGDESQVDQLKFRYPGPRPQSRETAILMLADGSEARVRAERPKDEAETRDLIQSVIQNRISAGQLDETNLTLHDLDVIADSFATTLRGMYHPRIEYPKLEQQAELIQDTNPTRPIIPRPASDPASLPKAES
ncbi:MAG TPA: HDIG domain-containing protein [Anaerolineales bacterium]|nr:HDIG domain-containing protein [Anaerolineales bacterium]